MKIPTLRGVVDPLKIIDNQNLSIGKLINKWVLIKNVSANKLILKPQASSFATVPWLVVDEDLTITAHGLWIIHDNRSSKIVLNDGSSLAFNARSYVASVNTLLNVYDDRISIYDLRSNSEDVILYTNGEIQVKDLQGTSIAIVSEGNRKYVLHPLLNRPIMEVSTIRLAESRTTALLAFKRKRSVYAFIYLKYLNMSKFYEVSECRDVTEVSVGDGLGFIKCSNDTYFLISLNKLLRMPLPYLRPLLTVSDEYFLHDTQYNVLVEFSDGEFKPLLLSERPRVLGRVLNDNLVVLSGNYPYILSGRLWKLMSNQRTVDGSTGTTYIVLQTLKSLDLYDQNGTLIASYKPIKCDLLNDNLICIDMNRNLLTYDVNKLKDVRIELTHHGESYPKLTISPWNEASKLIIKGPVTSLESERGDDQVKEMIIKPMKLDRELTFKVITDLVLARFDNTFKIRVDKPKIVDFAIKDVKYSTNGYLSNGYGNVLLKFYLTIYNPLPEDLTLRLKYMCGSSILGVHHHNLRSGTNEIFIEDSLRVTTQTLHVVIEYMWLNRSEELASFTLNLSKYVVKDPYENLELTTNDVGECASKLRVTQTILPEAPVRIVVTCADGREFIGVNEVTINRCKLPAVLELTYSYDVFTWRKYYPIMSGESLDVVVNVHNEQLLRSHTLPKCVNGFLDDLTKLVINVVNPLKYIIITPVNTSDGIKLRVCYELVRDGLLAVVVGDTVYALNGKSNEALIPVNPNLLTNLRIVLLCDGLREIYVIRYRELLRKYLELAYASSVLLKNAILGGVYGE